MEEATILTTAAYPLGLTRVVEDLVKHALSLAMEEGYHLEQDLGRSQDRPVLGPSLSVWPGTSVWDVLKWQFASELTGVEWKKSCLYPYEKLIANTSLAILREQECWLADRPVSVQTNSWGQIHATQAPAVVYGDGTELYVNDGNMLPKAFVLSPKHMELDAIDAKTAQPIRREKLIELYGVQNYLTARKAVAEASTDTATLWRVQAGDQGVVRVVELYEEHRLSGTAGLTFYQLPEEVTTLDRALAFVDEPDDVCRLVIENQSAKA